MLISRENIIAYAAYFYHLRYDALLFHTARLVCRCYASRRFDALAFAVIAAALLRH